MLLSVEYALPGGVAQLGERYLRKVEAVGSNPIASTNFPRLGDFYFSIFLSGCLL